MPASLRSKTNSPSTLGQGARWINRVLSLVTLLASGLLLLIGIGLSSAVLKQIRNSEEKYRNLINTANDAILVIDAETRLILEANNKAVRDAGHPRATTRRQARIPALSRPEGDEIGPRNF